MVITLIMMLPLIGMMLDSPSQTGFPQDAKAFIEQRNMCDHFRAEEGYDEERRQFIEERVATLCKGTDASLAALKEKHQTRPNVMGALSAYETKIER